MRAILTLAVLLVGVLISAEIHRDPSLPPQGQVFADPLTADRFSVDLSRGRIVVAGSSVSDAHEDALRALVAEHFTDAAAEFDLRPAVLPGTYWENASTRLLYLVASLESAAIVMQADAVEVRGVTSKPDLYASRAKFLEEALPPETRLSSDILIAKTSASFGELCERAFDNLQLGPVSFHTSSTEIRPGSLDTLERLTEFARDCQAVRIEIQGHTDSSGSEAGNRQLSLLRAQAVADRITANGIDPSRLDVRGFGSSRPIADNSTRRGREANRRIEFEIR